MRLLVLGGTVFLGRHLVEAALRRGHEVTLFNRGRHNPELFPDTEKLRGDRDGDLTALRGRRWHAAIDASGHVPRVVGAAAAALADAVEQYTFISSIGVYAGFPRTPGIDESFPVAALADATVEAVTRETVGPLKALCERAAEAIMPGRVLAIRAGLLAGPHDPTDRFTYWPRRVAQGGDVLAPVGPELRIQFADARDLAAWTLRMTEERRVGVYNATGPEHPLTLGELLDVCREVSGSRARFTWVTEEFLLRNNLGFMELPLWIPRSPGTSTVVCDRALAAGLCFRPLAETVSDTLTWSETRPRDGRLRAGIERKREAEVLEAWDSRHGGAAVPVSVS